MEKLQVQLILEILGRPKEHLKTALETLINKIDSEKGVKIIDKTIHEPVPVKDTQDLFTSFAELTAELDSIGNYFGILFAYMPSNIELINPERIELDNAELNALANQLVRRLHNYDAITKKMIADREVLLRKLAEAAPELFKEEALTKIKGKKTLKDTKKEKKSKKKAKKKSKKS